MPVDQPFNKDGVDLTQYNIYDVLGETKLDDEPNPGKGDDGVPYLNIEDPKWGTEQYPALDATGKPLAGSKKWATDALLLGLPVIQDKPVTCEDKCILASKKRIAACDTLRSRVKDALAKAGCPCDITGKDKVSSCGTTMSGLRAKYSRARRSRGRVSRSRPKRVIGRRRR